MHANNDLRKRNQFVFVLTLALGFLLNFASCSNLTSSTTTSTSASTPTPTPTIYNYFVYTANSTAGNVSAYTMDITTGLLTANINGPFAAGAGANSAITTPNNLFLYVGNNLASTVSAYSINKKTGNLTALTGSPFSLSVAPTFGAITPDGNHLYYTSSAGVYGFTVNTDGSLTMVAGSPFVGPTGEGIAIDPSGKYLYADKNSAVTIYAYSINSSTGVLTALTGSPFAEGGATGPNQMATTKYGLLYVAGVSGSVGGLAAFVVSSTPIPGAPVPIPNYPVVNVLSSLLGIDPTANFLFENDASNKIAGYILSPSAAATPTPITGSPFTVGSNASSFCFEPSAKYMYMTSNSVALIYGFSLGTIGGSSPGVPTATGTASFATGAGPSSCAVVKIQQ